MEGKSSKKAYHVIQPWSWKLRRSWLTKVVLLLLPLVLLVLLAPLIVAKTGLRGVLAHRALPKFGGTIEIGSASLGWFSPVLLEDLKVTDEQGNLLLSAATVRSEKTLWGLALDSAHLGKFRLEGMHSRLELRDNGSNIEDVLPQLMSTSSTKSSPVEYELAIVDSTVEIIAGSNRETYQLVQLSGEVASGKPGETPLAADLRGTLRDAAAKETPLQAKLSWNLPADPAGGLGSGQITARCDALPLRLAAAVSRRWCGDIQAQGMARCDLGYGWKDNFASQTVDLTQCEATGVSLAAPAYLGKDKLDLRELRALGKFSLVGERLVFDGTSLSAAVGKVTLTGGLKIRDLTSGAVLALARAVQEEDYQLQGDIDLAELARMLPQTMRLRDDLVVSSGQVRVSLASVKQPGGRGFQGRLETTNLAAAAGGRRVSWEQPISAAVSGQQAADGNWIADATCKSNFLSLVGHWQAGQGKLSLDGDLDQLAGQLTQLVDLGQTRLAGKVRADLDWKPATGDRFTLAGAVTAQNFMLSAAGMKPWKEEALLLTLSALGESSPGGVGRIESAGGQLVSGGDKCEVQLLRPVSNIAASTAFPLQLRLTGDLTSWTARLQPVLDVRPYDLSGRIELVGTCTGSSDRLQFEKLTATCDPFRLVGGGLAIDEPLVKIESTGTVDLAKLAVRSPVTTLASSSLAFRADGVELNLAGGLSASGDLAYRGDLARITGWLADPRTPAAQQWYGGLEGTARLRYADGATQAQLQTTLTNLVLAQRSLPPAGRTPPVAAAAPISAGSSAEPVLPAAGGATTRPSVAPAATNTAGPWQTVWQEPKLTLSGKAKYTSASDTASLEEMSVDATTLRLSATGQIAQLCKQMQLDLSGQIDYDWQNIMPHLTPLVGNDVQFSGRQSRSFKVRGPLLAASGGPLSAGAVPAVPGGAPGAAAGATLVAAAFPKDLAAEASLGWNAAKIYGQALGQGDVSGKLQSGVVRIDGLEFPVGSGKLRLAPWLDLNATPYLLRHDQALVAENVQLTTEMCQSWLQYMAPLVAKATRAQGALSLQLQSASVPLSNPYAADVAGVLMMQQAQIGPGPLTEQYLNLAQQLKAVLDKKSLTGLGALGALGGGASGGAAGGGTTWVNLAPQNVNIRVVQGRVYHERIQMQIKDVVIVSSGSVGLDQSLSMVAEIPIRDEWVASDRYLAGLRGQSLKIPVGGTLSAPQFDGRVVTDLARQAAGSAARGLLDDQLKKGLNKFLPPQ